MSDYGKLTLRRRVTTRAHARGKRPLTHAPRRCVAQVLLGGLTTCVALLGGAAGASAQQGGVGGVTVPQFPTTVTVGDQNVPASLSLVNLATGEYATDSFAVDQIRLTPSCGSKLGFGTCPLGGEDPGVFVPSATGVGRAGTACAGIAFTIMLIDPTTGQHAFTPASQVILGPTGTAGAQCIIDFTVNVARAPARDSDPAQATPGPLQTDQYATVRLTDVTPGTRFGQAGTATGSDETTVLRVQPTIGTQAAVAANGDVRDVATLGGIPAGAPTPTGTVTFSVYGPNDPNCTGPPVSSSTNPLQANRTATSSTFRPSAATGGPGTYRYVANYSGDVNYNPVTSPCNAPNENVTIPPPQITVTKAVTPATRAQPGGDFTYTVRVSNPSTNNPITITSLVDNIYGNLATRPGSTCGAQIGVTLQPGAQSAPCTFTAAFTGTAEQSLTDTVTVTGVDQYGFTATDTDQATVRITSPPPPPPPPPPPAGAGAGRVINGTAGRDVLVGTPASDVITCGEGDDVVAAGAGDDVINCGAGNDTIDAGTGNDRVDGGSGNDRVVGGPGLDRIAGGSGNDLIAAGSDNDTVDGGEGDDTISGNEGNDSLQGAAGNDRSFGNEGDDLLGGGAGQDRLAGNGGNDRASGDAGRDTIGGGSGNDRLSGGSGTDRVSGDSGRDSVAGGGGPDRLFGGPGRDVLRGGSGNDRLRGGPGLDRLIGGPGRDDSRQ